MINWVIAADELPAENEPVLLRNGSVVQHISYCWDGVVFTPYFFENDEILVPSRDVHSWVYVDDLQ